jgi:2-hydroxycyclohexanecarboxyl-CoA dehydrogenase
MSNQHRIALVTGSSRDIGRSTVLRLASEGCDVVVHSMSTVDEGEQVAREAEKFGVKSLYCQADLRDYDQVGGMIDRATSALGPINVLVNSAGWTSPGAFEDGNQELWDKIVQTKFFGFIYTVFHNLPHMKAQGWGKIVNVVGESGRIGISKAAVHSGVQGGIIAMTKSWAREFAEYGIRVNAVSPGPIDTTEMARYEATLPSLFVPGSEMTSVLGRATPDDVAAAIAFFAREESDKITGQTLSVSGGRAFAG